MARLDASARGGPDICCDHRGPRQPWPHRRRGARHLLVAAAPRAPESAVAAACTPSIWVSGCCDGREARRGDVELVALWGRAIEHESGLPCGVRVPTARTPRVPRLLVAVRPASRRMRRVVARWNVGGWFRLCAAHWPASDVAFASDRSPRRREVHRQACGTPTPAAGARAQCLKTQAALQTFWSVSPRPPSRISTSYPWSVLD